MGQGKITSEAPKQEYPFLDPTEATSANGKLRTMSTPRACHKLINQSRASVARISGLALVNPAAAVVTHQVRHLTTGDGL